MNRIFNWLCAGVGALGLAATSHAAGFGAFGPNGEGGTLNSQVFTVGASGEVFEVDAFLNIGTLDLNGAVTGTSARLSVDALPAGVGYAFAASLSGDGTDVTLSYAFTNASASTLPDVRFFSFLDVEIAQRTNTFFNEFGVVDGVQGGGFADPDPDSWDIDEPDYVDGRIVRRLHLAALGDANNIPEFPVDDVAMALGFTLGDLPPGSGVTAEILISEDGDRFGTLALTQYDRESTSNTVVTFSGRATFTGPPVITLLGSNPFSVECSTPFVDPGATAVDGAGLDITGDIVVDGTVDPDAAGTYALTYQVSDARGVAAEPAIRIVDVVDTTPPSALCRDVTIELAADGGASTLPALHYLEPRAGETLTNGNVLVRFATTNWLAGGADDTHVRFFLDDEVAPLVFLNGGDNVILANGIPSVTADWVDPGSLRLLGLSNGVHALRARLTMANGLPLDEPRADVEVVFSVDDTAASTAATVRIDFPLPGETVRTQDVLVGFAAGNWIVGGKGDPHIHFHIDGSPHRLMFYNGTNEIVELNTVPGTTPLATWVDATTIRLRGLSDGVHTVRAQLANPDMSPVALAQGEAVATAQFTVATGEDGLIAYLNPTEIDNGSSDACGLAALTLSQTLFTLDDIPTQTVTLTAVDINGLTNVCSALVTIEGGPPKLVLNGASNVTVDCGFPYIDAGATATDALGVDISALVVVSVTVDVSVVDTYVLNYDVIDDRGLSAPTVTRTVTVVDTNAPVIALTGVATQTLECASAYVELGATANDACAGDVSSNIVIDASAVIAGAPGTYTVTYDVTDAFSNAAVQVVRTVNVVDTTSPVITLTGVATQTLECASAYVELGATASDACEGDLSSNIVIDASAVIAGTPGTYSVTYDVSDAFSNAAVQVVRTVNVVDTTSPVITLTGVATQTLECASAYVELGATANDACVGDVSSNIVIDASAVIAGTPGTYSVTYDVSDAFSNAAVQVVRTVNVVDTTSPVITLTGVATQILECASAYVELGATANDACAGDVSSNIVIDASAVIAGTPGRYSVTYDVSDAFSNAAAQIVRTVNVVDATAPVITLTGVATQILECASAYVELGATAADACEGDLSSNIVIDASGVVAGTPGIYTVTYDASDAFSNAAVQVTRTVEVVDTSAPVIALTGVATQTLECASAYVELGATAADACEGDLSSNIVVDASAVVAGTPGTYSVTYDVSDAFSNAAAQVVRTVNVVDTTSPVITLTGVATQILECASPYVELGATAADACEGDLSSNIVIDASAVIAGTPGTYSVTYDVSDAFSNAAAQVVRTVNVVDTTSPVITQTGVATQILECASAYVELGATAADACEGDLSSNIVIDASAVIAGTPGIYTVTYDVSDAFSNAAVQVVRTVNVVDATAPVLTLTGVATQTLECASVYVELGATAADACEGDLSSNIVIDASAVIAGTPGRYSVTYDVSDAFSNAAAQIVRTVNVVDTTSPVITLTGVATQILECASAYVELGATAADACEGDLSSNIVIDASGVVAGTPGTYTVTYDVSDAFSNAAAQVTRTVEVVDTTIPGIVCPSNVVLECPADTGTNATGVASASDACGSVTVGFVDQSTAGCGGTETIVRRWTAVDATGNSNFCDQVIALIDTLDPQLVCPADTTLDCPADTNVTATGVGLATDLCGAASVSFSDVVFVGPESPGGGQLVPCVFGRRFTFDGGDKDDEFGTSVAGVGDLDGDAVADFIVGSPGRDGAAVFSGTDGRVVLELEAVDDESRFGFLVADAGDLNTDTVGDVLVGSYTNATAGGLVASVAAFSGVDGAFLGYLTGPEIADLLATTIAEAGDIDGDFVGDFVVETGTGNVEVISGFDGSALYSITVDNGGRPTSVSGPGDVDGDGRPDILVGAAFASPGGRVEAGSAFVFSGADGGLLFRIDGEADGDGLGLSVSGVGDQDGDGRIDIGVGAPLADPDDERDAGSVYVVACSDPAPGLQCGVRTIERTWTAVDECGRTTSCVQRITEVDTTPPVIDCDAFDISEIKKNDPPVSFTATAADACGEVVVAIVDVDCVKRKPVRPHPPDAGDDDDDDDDDGGGDEGGDLSPEALAQGDDDDDDPGKPCKKLDFEVNGDTIILHETDKAGAVITWTVVATDACGNVSTEECSITIIDSGTGDDDDDDI